MFDLDLKFQIFKFEVLLTLGYLTWAYKLRVEMSIFAEAHSESGPGRLLRDSTPTPLGPIGPKSNLPWTFIGFTLKVNVWSLIIWQIISKSLVLRSEVAFEWEHSGILNVILQIAGHLDFLP